MLAHHSPKPHRFIVRLYPEDILGLAFCAILAILSLQYGTSIKGPTVVVRTLINAILIVIGFALLAGRLDLSLFKIVRNWLPIVIVLMSYENLGNLVRFINPHDADPVLKRIDEIMFFGVNPTLWLEPWTRPWLSEIMHSCYTSYYPFLPIIGFILYASRDYHRFRNVMVSVTLGFYLGYIGYLLVPTVGPRFFMADQFTVDTKGVTMLSDKVAQMINQLESTRRDCFPSLHTAITVIVTTYAFKYRRWLFWFLMPVNVGIIMATVYLRYHYVVDVLAGLALAAFCVWAGPKVNDFWYRRVTGDHVLDDYPRTIDFLKWTGPLGKYVRAAFGRGEVPPNGEDPR